MFNQAANLCRILLFYYDLCHYFWWEFTHFNLCKGDTYAFPNKGYCASQSSNYYGYKLHAICSLNGVFQSVDLTPAPVHDVNYLKDITSQIKDCTLIGDRGYLSTEI
ncbi:MAG: transposase [Lutibacter sp.]|nr:transposase [Lutibacter sp.]